MVEKNMVFKNPNWKETLTLTATLPPLPSMIFHVTLLYRLFLTFLIQTDGPVARQAMIV